MKNIPLSIAKNERDTILKYTTFQYKSLILKSPGKLVGGFCALSGVFILTLPIPIVVNRLVLSCTTSGGAAQYSILSPLQFCDVLQEQAVEDRGQHQEEGEDETAGRRDEGNAEVLADQGEV